MSTIRWNLLAWTLLSGVLVSHTVLASPKAWLTDQRIVIDHGGIQVLMTKDAARNVDWGSFYADASNRTNGINIAFAGSCSP
ncbi:MAG: hypothetical protein GXP16_11510, partial [Gammaproteobacteria bacterium]|nr:hypothetical protein [Gammaproteobacteria bacterium]